MKHLKIFRTVSDFVVQTQNALLTLNLFANQRSYDLVVVMLTIAIVVVIYHLIY